MMSLVQHSDKNTVLVFKPATQVVWPVALPLHKVCDYLRNLFLYNSEILQNFIRLLHQ